MQFLTDQLQFLGLKENEIRVFTALATFGQMKISGIVRKSGVARSTIVGMLPRMLEQGVVREVIVQKHYEYTVNLEEVANKLDWLEQRLRNKRLDDTAPTEEGADATTTNTTKEQGGVATREAPSATASIAETFVQYAGTRMQLLLARDDAETLEHTLTRAEEYLSYITKNNMQAVLITCPTIAEYLQKGLSQDALPTEAHRVRIHVVPQAHCATEYDIIAFHGTVLLCGIHNHTITALATPAAVETYNHLLRVARGVGWSVSAKEWVG